MDCGHKMWKAQVHHHFLQTVKEEHTFYTLTRLDVKAKAWGAKAIIEFQPPRESSHNFCQFQPFDL